MRPYYQDDWVTIYHGDCRDILPKLDKVDLVLTDPPYGIGESSTKIASRNVYRKGLTNSQASQRDYGEFHWDDKPVDWELLWSLLSLGKYACCFGGNYYPFPPSSCWLVWDKQNGTNDFADCELAWTNYGSAVRIKQHLWNGMLRKDNECRYHPTQKPLGVLIWALQLCPGEPQTILDPFLGSGTTLVAAKQLGRKAIGIEIEEKYCEIAAKRMTHDQPWEREEIKSGKADKEGLL